MYKTFNLLSPNLGERYLNVEACIKTKSDSFSSSLLELLEALLKTIYREEDIKIDSEYDTAIGILKVQEFKDFCLEIGVSSISYEKLFELAKAGNQNKHEEIVHVSLEKVLFGLKYVFEIAVKYLEYKHVPVPDYYDSDAISELYGSTQRELLQKEKERAELLESLSVYEKNNSLLEGQYAKLKEIKEKNEVHYRSIEEKNIALSKEIDELKNIKLSTLEQKIVIIIDLLSKEQAEIKKLNGALEKVNESLKHARAHNWGGKPTIIG